MEKTTIKNSSIKDRLMRSFMFLIIITVVFLEVLVISGIKHYYYKNIEELLGNQLDFSVEYLVRYLDVNQLEDIIMNDIDLFWNQTTAQIQLYDNTGNLLLDSLGVDFSANEKYSDIEKALKGSKGVLIGKTPYYKDEVISISKPIVKDNEIIGVLRFTSSMKETKDLVTNISFALIAVGSIVILISGILSWFLSNSIVKPLKEVTDIAEKMADGDLGVKSKVKLNDEIGRLATTLNYMSEEILKRDEIKNDFIASISHELKTPLTSIKGWAITLQDEEDIAENELIYEGLKIIESESDRLSDMLEELLDFSRFVSGDIILKREIINIKEILIKTYKQLLPTSEINKINLRLDLDENIGEIIGDKDRIKQVLINLLDNAFKFTQENGNVLIKADLIDEKIIIKIIDDGLGIGEDELPHITEKFYKGKSSKSHAGIGLSIVKEIIDLHLGSLDIKSEIDKGTTIIIQLPIGEM